MDKLILGLFQSDQPEKVKRQIFRKMRVSAPNSIKLLPPEKQQNLLNVCLHYFLVGNDFENEEGKLMLKELLINCLDICYNMFTEKFFGNIVIGRYYSSILENKNDNTVNSLTISISRRVELFNILLENFKNKGLKKHEMYIHIYVQTEAIRLLYDCHDHKTFAILCFFLENNAECLPPPNRYFALCTVSIHAMSDFYPLDDDSDKRNDYLNDISKISEFLRFIWQREPAVLMPSLQEIFAIISKTSEIEPSNALGCLVEHIPSVIIDNSISQIINDPIVSDEQMETALRRMIAWVGWPNAKLVNLWVLAFFKQLENIAGFDMLISVTIKTVKQVFLCLKQRSTRASSLAVFVHMMLSFQSSAEAFLIVVPYIPKIFSDIESENDPDNESCLAQLSNICQCMMYLHSGFPDLYAPILDCIKDYPKATEKVIKNVLKCNAWKPKVFYRTDLLLSRSKETGKAGLVNLGNTCYINSIIQALFMIDEFRFSILKCTPSSSSVMSALYETFSFLLLTQRIAYEPKKLVQSSRPAWFTEGTQQDCSEYLKHLLDCLNEEEKSCMRSKKGIKPGQENSSGSCTTKIIQEGSMRSDVTSLVENLFHGKIRSSIICSSCNFQSSRDETFVDFALPLNKAEERGGIVDTKAGSDSPNSEEHAQGTSSEMTITSQTGEPPTTASSSESRVFVDTEESADSRMPVQVEDVEEEDEVTKRSHRLVDLLHDALTEEYMTGDNQYRCSQCGVLRDAIKTTAITSLPKYFIISLLRFTYDLKEQRRSKIMDIVEISQEIEIPLYKEEILTPVRYSLNAVVFHSGLSAESGHYYCYAKLRGDHENTWCLFNDSHVSLATFQTFAHLTEQFSRDTAYVLFYARTDIRNENIDESQLIHENVRSSIEDDNESFIKEVEEALKKVEEVKMGPSNVLGWNDEDDPPPPTCGGGGDGNISSNQLVC